MDVLVVNLPGGPATLINVLSICNYSIIISGYHCSMTQCTFSCSALFLAVCSSHDFFGVRRTHKEFTSWKCDGTDEDSDNILACVRKVEVGLQDLGVAHGFSHNVVLRDNSIGNTRKVRCLRACRKQLPACHARH